MEKYQTCARLPALLLVLNSVACLVFLFLWAYTAFFAPMNSALRVTDLDRAGVFNEDQLNKFNPALADNLRHNVALWISEVPVSCGVRASQLAAILALANIATLLALRHTVRRSLQKLALPETPSTAENQG